MHMPACPSIGQNVEHARCLPSAGKASSCGLLRYHRIHEQMADTDTPDHAGVALCMLPVALPPATVSGSHVGNSTASVDSASLRTQLRDDARAPGGTTCCARHHQHHAGSGDTA